jgi:hypothetical protein
MRRLLCSFLVHQVYGQGILNPYRLHPFVGAKVPAEVTYRPPIEIYNPHDTPLHVTEIFTSGGFLHLTLPPGIDDENTAQLWVRIAYDRSPCVMLAPSLTHTNTNTDHRTAPKEEDHQLGLHVATAWQVHGLCEHQVGQGQHDPSRGGHGGQGRPAPNAGGDRLCHARVAERQANGIIASPQLGLNAGAGLRDLSSHA